MTSRFPKLPFALLLLIFATLSLAQQTTRPKPPMDTREEISKFFPYRKGSNTAERLAGYEIRMKMEKDSFFSKLMWRNVGPEHQSGRVLAIATPLNKPDDLYVAFATGGLWRTRDWGISWESLFDQESSFGIGQIALSADGQTIWVGTGEPNSQRTSYQGTGVFKSTDSGKTWQHMGLADTNHIGAVVMDPKNPNTVYVAALGHLYSANDDRGVFKTTDGGKTWQHVLKINDLTGVAELVMDPTNSNVLYASGWERERRAWDFRDSGPGTAVFKSVDAGKTWTKLTNGLPSGDLGRIGLAVAKSKPNVLYAFVDNWNADPDSIYEDEYTPSGQLTPRRFMLLDKDKFVAVEKATMTGFLRSTMPAGTDIDKVIADVGSGKMTLSDVMAAMEKRNPEIFTLERVTHEIYRSDDSGKTWKRTHGYKFGNHGGYYWGKIRVNPNDENDLVTMGVSLLRSRDGGKSWERTGFGLHADHHEFFYDPKVKGRLLSGNDGGPYISGDDGKTWRHLNNLPVGQTTTLAVDMKTPYNIYVGLQDNGTIVGPSNSPIGRGSTSPWKSIGGGDGSWVAVDPRDNGDVVYIASQFGFHSRLNQATGERASVTPPDRPGESENRFNWISPLIISSFHPDILYCGAQRVYRSFDQGRTWSPISADLTKNRPVGDVPHSTIKTLAESPLRFGLLYAGTDDGKVMMTPDGGLTWRDISTPENDKWVSRVVASKWDVNTVYVTQSGYRDDDYKAYIWKSTDQGKTWTSIVGDLPEGFIESMCEDPVRKEMLYVAALNGVWVSFNGGRNWEPLMAGIPHIAIHDVLVHLRDMDIVAASHGRSVFVMSARPLQMLTDEIRAKALHVWTAPDMPYSSRWPYQQRPNWDASPPNEPTASGWFWSKTAGQASIIVKDKDGKTVKTVEFNAVKGMQQWEVSMLLDPAGDKSKVDVKNRKVTTAEEALADPLAGLRAKYIQPGEYTLELTVGGQKATTAWKVVVPQQPQGPGGRRRGDGDG
ncbi:MAG: hypothetical protein KF784_11675 [Fimbriimonadaceae bacterium]|nr:hypothetical protein [Fimbriimonadaceae bacterium]